MFYHIFRFFITIFLIFLFIFWHFYDRILLKLIFFIGKTSGRGHKGQKARSGGGVRRGFEGGQTPLYRRLPKRGFTNRNSKNYTEVTLTMLNKSKATDVTAESLLEEGIIGKINDGIVVLATGKLEKKL